MNKPSTLSILTIAASLMFAGCSHSQTATSTPTVAPHATISTEAPTAETPSAQAEPSEPEVPSVPEITEGPFTGQGFKLDLPNTFMGRIDDDGDLEVRSKDKENRVKMFLRHEEFDGTLQASAVIIKEQYKQNSITIHSEKSVVVNGVKAITFDTNKDNVHAFITILVPKQNDKFLFGCGGLNTNKKLVSTCTMALSKLHLEH